MELAVLIYGGETTFARVRKRLKDANGLPIGTLHKNPILDTRVYEVEYADGHKASTAAIAITMTLFAQVDTEGNHHSLFEKNVYQCTDGKEIKQQDEFVMTKNGIRRH